MAAVAVGAGLACLRLPACEVFTRPCAPHGCAGSWEAFVPAFVPPLWASTGTRPGPASLRLHGTDGGLMARRHAGVHHEALRPEVQCVGVLLRHRLKRGREAAQEEVDDHVAGSVRRHATSTVPPVCVVHRND